MDSIFSEDTDGTGTITTIAAETCAVSVTVNGTSTVLSFKKNVLYVWGNQCEGDMTHLLEEDMEVNLCYKVTKSRENPSIVAVWIGDKPNLSNIEELLENIYALSGIVQQILNESTYMIQVDGMPYTVIISRDVMYRDGTRLGVDGPDLAVNEFVTFDAMPFESKQACKAMYRATCAWVGSDPRLVDRFSLDVTKSAEENPEICRRGVYGNVVLIPNDVVAFVEVEGVNEKFILFRGSFSQSCERLQDVVKVGDRLCVKLCYGYIFPGVKQGFVRKVWISGEEMKETEEDTWIIQPDACHPVVDLDDQTESVDSEYTGIRGGSPMSNEVSFEGSEDEESDDFDCPSSEKDCLENSSAVPVDVNMKVLYGEPPLQGILGPTVGNPVKAAKHGFAAITFKGINVFVDRCNVYKNGRITELSEFQKLVKSKPIVNFEAILCSVAKYKMTFTHYATCVWIGGKPSLSEVASSLGNKVVSETTGNLVGKVVTFYLPDMAVIQIGNNTRRNKYWGIFLHQTELGFGSKPIKGNSGSQNYICDFVQIGSIFEFQVRPNDAWGMCAYNIVESSKLTLKTFTKAENKAMKKKVILKKTRRSRSSHWFETTNQF